jgi:putative phosphoesterase
MRSEDARCGGQGLESLRLRSVQAFSRARRALHDPPADSSSMLIAIISDTHLPRGQRRLPAECVLHLRAADLIIHAGDFSACAVLEQLGALGPPVRAVRGNAEEPTLRRLLPIQLELSCAGVNLAVTHDAGPASGRLARMRRRFPNARAVIFGHSHIPLLEGDGAFQIFNPGSPTDRRRQPQHTMGLARVEDGEIAFRHLELGP